MPNKNNKKKLIKIPETFLLNQERLEEVIKKSLEEHEESKRPTPADLSGLDFEAVEIEYTDGTREVIKVDLIKYLDNIKYDSIYGKEFKPNLIEFFEDKKNLYIIDEKNPKIIIKIIKYECVRAIRTNYLTCK